MPSERLRPQNRLRSATDHARVRALGVAFRGAHCLVVACAAPGELTRVGFVASRRSVGNAVQRNRARRRLREIVRRRWERVPETGYLLMVVAFGSATTAPHQDLATDVEHVLAAAGALRPVMDEPLAR
jgi:ribonuclease P protein component